MKNEVEAIDISIPNSLSKRFRYENIDGSSFVGKQKRVLYAAFLIVLLVIVAVLVSYSLGSRVANSGAAGSGEREPLVETNFPPSATNDLMVCSSGDVQLNGRKFELYVPSGVSSESPIVFIWHGITASPSKIESKVQMKEEANKENWVLVYPYGTGLLSAFDGMGCCMENGPDSVQFAKDIIDYLQENNCGNVLTVFSTGFSNGAFMNHKLGCEAGLRPDPTEGTWFKALAPHSGLIGEYSSDPLPDIGDYPNCKVAENERLPIISFHGTQDTVVGYDGKNHNPFSNAQWYSYEDTMTHWKNVHECSDADYEDGLPEGSTCQSCCRGSICDVVMCSIDGLDHEWSGYEGSRNDVDATDMIVNFFKKYI